MTSQTPDIQAVLDRVEKLEKQNRRLKRACVLALAAVGAVALMGQGAPQKRIIRAQKFDLVDSSGKTRASFGITGAQGHASLSLFGENGRLLLLTTEGLDVSNGQEFSIRLEDSDYSPFLTVVDKQGFKSVLGVTKLSATGETRQTSAASLVMVGKDGKVIWHAP